MSSGVASRGHSNAAVSVSESENIIYAVARHSHCMAGFLQRADKLSLLIRRHASEYSVFFACFSHIFFLKPGCVNKVLRSFNACFPRDLGYCQRIIAGDDLDLYPLVRKIAEGRRRAFAHRVHEQDQSNGIHRTHQWSSVKIPPVFSKCKHPVAKKRILFDQLPVLPVGIRENEFRSAHDIVLIPEYSSAVFISR